MRAFRRPRWHASRAVSLGGPRPVHRDMYLLTSKDRGRTFALAESFRMEYRRMRDEHGKRCAVGERHARGGGKTERSRFNFGKLNGGASAAIGAPGPPAKTANIRPLAVNSRGEQRYLPWTRKHGPGKKGGTHRSPGNSMDADPETAGVRWAERTGVSGLEAWVAAIREARWQLRRDLLGATRAGTNLT